MDDLGKETWWKIFNRTIDGVRTAYQQLVDRKFVGWKDRYPDVGTQTED